MQDHSVRMTTTADATRLEFAPNFNVAVPFIDRHLAEERGAKVAIRETTGREVTYAELVDRVNRCGNALHGLGLAPGDRVLMMVKDCAEFVFLFWGTIKAGYVPVPLNTMLRAKDYAFMIEDSGCTAVVYSPEFAGEVEPALEKSGHRPDHILRTEADGDCLVSRIDAASAELDPAPAQATDDCFWLYSSGTTGSPKGTVHLHRDMVVTSQLYGVDTLGVQEDDICFSAAKLFFAYGLGNGMTFPLWVGATAVLFPARPAPDNTLETIATFKPTLYFGVPTLYAAQLAYLESHDADFGSVRHCVSAGEALPADIFRRWKEKSGTVILDGIGSTEALHIFISNTADDCKAGTSGRMVKGYQSKIIDDAGKAVAQGDSGQLLIKGDSMARYYWNNPAKTAQTMLDNDWLNTGDTYLQDEDGYFVYCGRNDDMLKVGGIWCSPFEIEAKLIEHPKVLEAAVVGRGDAHGLIKPEAYVVLNDPGEAGEEMSKILLEHCKGGLAPYKYPRWFQFTEELPKTATGKIQRYRLLSAD